MAPPEQRSRNRLRRYGFTVVRGIVTITVMVTMLVCGDEPSSIVVGEVGAGACVTGATVTACGNVPVTPTGGNVVVAPGAMGTLIF